ncbi:MAG: nucleotidyltransferase family protein [Candidatus Aminicenantes bacterium]|nr:nucleotidyltransferase family protein [Candidatus Aminicenantes bacterium]MDH5466947.1 nucleotidyltransferase family protein [Candidatus Aminicenantes bacterium]MDH5705262.1 nucleotidyltransferase family protein [Candidatus Aminicenantes bacterium]
MEQHELLLWIVRCFEKLKIPYLITGAIASIAYGEPRFTNDIDIVADLNLGQASELRSFFPEDEFYMDDDTVRNAIRSRYQFNIIHPSSGLKVDVIISKKDDFDQSRFKRIKRLNVSEEESANFAAPEDVIIKKLEYFKKGGSEKHLRDIASMLKISADMIDCTYISSWAEKLGLTEIWEAIQKKLP